MLSIEFYILFYIKSEITVSLSSALAIIVFHILEVTEAKIPSQVPPQIPEIVKSNGMD